MAHVRIVAKRTYIFQSGPPVTVDFIVDEKGRYRAQLDDGVASTYETNLDRVRVQYPAIYEDTLRNPVADGWRFPKPAKQHNQDAGYVAERGNPYVKGSKVVIYRAAEQGIDVDAKFAVVCDAHGQHGGEATLPSARTAMKDPAIFCSECMELAISRRS